MEDIKIVRKPWKDIDDTETEILCVDVDRLYTVSELIAMLEKAKELWGDKSVAICDLSTKVIGGFFGVYLHKGFDEREALGEDYYQDDMICIFG